MQSRTHICYMTIKLKLQINLKDVVRVIKCQATYCESQNMSTNALFMTFIYLKIWRTNSTKCVLKVKRDSIKIARQ